MEDRRKFLKTCFVGAVGLISGAALSKILYPPTQVYVPCKNVTVTEKKYELRYDLKKLNPVLRYAAKGLDEANSFCKDFDCVEFPQITALGKLFNDSNRAYEVTNKVIGSFDKYVSSVQEGIKKIEPLQPAIESVKKNVEKVAKGGSPDESILKEDKIELVDYNTIFSKGKLLTELFLNDDKPENALDTLDATHGFVKFATKALLPKMIEDLKGLKKQAENYQKYRGSSERNNMWDDVGLTGFWGYLRALKYETTLSIAHSCYQLNREISDCGQLFNLIFPDDDSVKHMNQKIDFRENVFAHEDEYLKRIVPGKAARGINRILSKFEQKDRDVVVESIARMLEKEPSKAVELVYVGSSIANASDEVLNTTVNDLQDLLKRGRYHDGFQLIRLFSPTLWPYHSVNINERTDSLAKKITPDLSLPQLEIMKKANILISDNINYSISLPHAVESFEMARYFGKGGKPVGDGAFRAGALYFIASKAGVESYYVKFYPPGLKTPIYVLEAIIEKENYAFGSKVNGLSFDDFLREGNKKEFYNTRKELSKLPRQHFDLNLAGAKVVREYNV